MTSERQFVVAIVGATGVVGQSMLEILAERKFPISKLHLLASEKSEGKRLAFRDAQIKVENLATFDFTGVDFALFSAGGSISADYAPKAAAAGCVVIDNTSHFRYEADVPLIVPEVNPEMLGDYRKRGIIANPNCSTIQMVMALKPIHDAVTITSVNVATYQAVSGSGQSAVSELAKQTADLLNAQEAVCKVYPKQIAFNVLPQIDVFMENGYTKEEMKMVWETQKILGDESIKVNPTAVRVPVFFGHSEAVHIETKEKITRERATELFASMPGVEVIDEREPGGYATAVSEAANHDAVYISRIRENISTTAGLNFWVVADNVRKGAALNSVQIAELLVKSYL